MTSIPTIERLSATRREATSPDEKSKWGQYFTPGLVAGFMADLAMFGGERYRILDAGAGTGILGAAAVEAAFRAGVAEVELIAVEMEPGAAEALHRTVQLLRDKHGSALSAQIIESDFLELGEPSLGQPALPANFDLAIGNPPYFKMSPSKPRGGNAPNAYARFMEVAAQLLKPRGELIFIVPRSYTSGIYFKKFRRRFHEKMVLERVHVFESRREAFKVDDVLQENIIVRYRKDGEAGESVEVSSSESPSTLDSIKSYQVDRELVLPSDHPHGQVFLPASAEQIKVIQTLRAWPNVLDGLGLDISTGPVVPFRTTAMVASPNGERVVPLLWMQHVKPGRVAWPLDSAMRKPEYILADAPPKLLVTNDTYVLLRRFSAKEEPRRLTAAVLEKGKLPGDLIGLENHLNFVHRPGGSLEKEEAIGIAAIFSTTLVDDYFRLANGNTQVNATDISALPLPDAATLRRLGEAVESKGTDFIADREGLDALVDSLLDDQAG